MPTTINVYSEIAVIYLAKYGAFGNAKPAYEHAIYAILCSTDIVQFNSSFTGRVDQLLSSGVVELPTANGYNKYGQQLRHYYTGIQQQRFNPLVSSTGTILTNITLESFKIISASGFWRGLFIPSTRQFPLQTPSDINYSAYSQPIQSLTWQATSGPLNVKSLLLCYRTSAPPAGADVIYSSSYPLAMVDFGGTITAAAGQFLNLPYPPVADIFRWRVE